MVEHREPHQVVGLGQPGPPLELAVKLPAIQRSGRLGPNRVFQQALPRVAAYVQDNLEA